MNESLGRGSKRISAARLVTSDRRKAFFRRYTLEERKTAELPLLGGVQIPCWLFLRKTDTHQSDGFRLMPVPCA